MRSTLLVALAAGSALAWNPFQAKPEPAAAAVEPQAEAAPNVPVAGDAEAIFFHDPVQGATPALSQTASASVTPTTTRRTPFVIPTPIDFFNGNKSQAHEAYAGPEYRWKRFVFRPGLFQQEAVALLVVALLSVAIFLTKDGNKARAQAWLEANRQPLEQAFAAVDAAVTPNGTTQYKAWASGRKGLAGLQVALNLKPRQDPVAALYHLARSVLDLNYQGARDQAVLELLLADEGQEHQINDALVAVLARPGMQATRKRRWDLRALATLSTSTALRLPPAFAVFQETALSAEATLKAAPSLLEWLNGEGEGQRLLESFLISDIGGMTADPSEESLASAEPFKKSRRVVVTLNLPARASQYGETVAPLIAAINTADALSQSKGQLISQSEASKIKKRRLDIVKDLTKDYVKEQAESNATRIREAKKKEADAKYNAMSPQQQKKADELARKRASKQGSMKMARK